MAKKPGSNGAGSNGAGSVDEAMGAAESQTILKAASLPLIDPEDRDYISRHVELRMDGPVAKSLSALRKGLDAGHYRTENGKPVTTNTDAIRWLLERMAAGELLVQVP
jgi:hypothetical protein